MTNERPQVYVIPQECIKVLAEAVTDAVQQIDWKALTEKMAERPKGEWIPITMRPIEEEDKISFPDATFMFTCPMPEDGQEILITTKYGVAFDTCYSDDGYYLDSDRDWEDVIAWQPLPEPYKEAQ